MQDKEKIDKIGQLLYQLQSSNSVYNDADQGYYFNYDKIIHLLEQTVAILDDTLRCLRPKDLPEEIPWSERVNHGDDLFDQFNPYVFDGTMSVADYNRLHDTYSIYQLKSGMKNYRFESLESLHKKGLSIEKINYDLIYTENLTPFMQSCSQEELLGEIFLKFNIDRPSDFKGHALSVSDVIVIHQDGQDAAYYCDPSGFSKLPVFAGQEMKLTFYVAECMEFSNIGEYHDNLTLKEAIRIYESIPVERRNAGKGIGFHLSGTDFGEFGIMTNGVVDADIFYNIPEFRDSPLVQQMIKAFPGADVVGELQISNSSISEKRAEVQETQSKKALEKDKGRISIEAILKKIGNDSFARGPER